MFCEYINRSIELRKERWSDQLLYLENIIDRQFACFVAHYISTLLTVNLECSLGL